MKFLLNRKSNVIIFLLVFQSLFSQIEYNCQNKIDSLKVALNSSQWTTFPFNILNSASTLCFTTSLLIRILST